MSLQIRFPSENIVPLLSAIFISPINFFEDNGSKKTPDNLMLNWNLYSSKSDIPSASDDWLDTASSIKLSISPTALTIVTEDKYL